MRFALVLMVGMLCVSSAATAEVMDAQDNGFAVRLAVDIAAPPPVVFRVVTEQVGSWWSSSHTFSGDAANLSMEARPGGCFCEKMPNGGVRHMTVTHVMAPGTLVLNGGLGPLGTMASAGAMQLTFTAQGGATHVEMTYNVSGYAPGGLKPMAPLVDGVLAEQMKRLKAFVETGRAQQD